MMKIALIGPTDRSIWAFRKGLIKELIKQRHSVFVICSNGPYVELIKSLGAIHIHTKMPRFIDPIGDIIYFLNLLKFFKREKFDIVHNFTIKPNFYGSIAAKLSKIKQVLSLVEGLGFAYSDECGLKPWIQRHCFLCIYYILFKLTTRVWLINRDDMSTFINSGIIDKDKIVFIRSVGVDQVEYSMTSISVATIESLRKEFNIKHNSLVVSMVARMTWSKGVKEFVEASKILNSTCPTATFLLVGEIQPGSPLSVPEEYLTSVNHGNFKWLDFRNDVPAILALSDVVVLPSYYREGVPRSLLEAMSMGKPIITTDNPGCREVVQEKRNGFLVPIKNSFALASAIGELLSSADKRLVFGQHSRQMVENEFAEELITRRVLKDLYRFS